MRLPSCVACGLPVLELRGQYTKLDSFLIRNGVPPVETAGTYHAACLAVSPSAGAWGTALVQSFVGTRGYQKLGEAGDWTIVRNPRTHETLALGGLGSTFALGFGKAKPRDVPGGKAYPEVDREYGFEWDAPIVHEIQTALRGPGSYSLLQVAESLGIRDRLSHPEVLEAAAFRFDPELEPEWRREFVWCAVEYSVFVPDVLVRWVSEK